MPAARSPAQSATALHNGALSRGPFTDAGKAASSSNAARHGIGSARLEVDGAAAEHMEWHLEVAMRDWSP